MNEDLVSAVESNVCNRFQIDGSGQNTAVLMICMVTADLGSAGSRKLIMLIHNLYAPYYAFF